MQTVSTETARSRIDYRDRRKEDARWVRQLIEDAGLSINGVAARLGLAANRTHVLLDGEHTVPAFILREVEELRRHSRYAPSGDASPTAGDVRESIERLSALNAEIASDYMDGRLDRAEAARLRPLAEQVVEQARRTLAICDTVDREGVVGVGR